MSFDLAVFDPNSAPTDRADFIVWYRAQTQWSEKHSYDDPAVCAPALRAWFHEMREQFPPLNGPFRSEGVDDPKTTDYSLGRSIVYAAFAWSEEAEARDATFELAKKHGIGFFDVSSDDGDVWAPSSYGTYECIHSRGSI